VTTESSSQETLFYLNPISIYSTLCKQTWSFGLGDGLFGAYCGGSADASFVVQEGWRGGERENKK
jgi:hypothetical protein